MTKKVILSTALGFIFMMGVQAQEKKNKTINSDMNTTLPIKKADKKVNHPEANVNFDQALDTRTMGQDVVTSTTMTLDGIVVGDMRSSSPLEIDKTRIISIEFKSDNPNAMFYIVDRLENVVVPATESTFKEELRAGHYLLKVGLTPEAVKNEEKANYSFLIQ